MRHISNTTALQISQVFRYVILLLISVLLAKSDLTAAEISVYETFIFLSTILSHFWTSSVIQSLLAVYKQTTGNGNRGKSPAFFNSFIILIAYSILTGIGIGFFSGTASQILSGLKYEWLPLYLILYLVLNNPSFLIEPIYLLERKPVQLLIFGFLSYSLQLALVTLPLFSGLTLEASFTGLLSVSALRMIWLMVLLRQYSSFTISPPYLKMHIRTAVPIIIYSLIAASEEYIGGLIVKWKFSPEAFAIYRFGAKELPLSFLLANALSNAMVPEFSANGKRDVALNSLKNNSKRLMHIIFPVSIALMIFSGWLYPWAFNPAFAPSAAVFNIFLLLAVGRVVFPQTILLGLRKNHVMVAAVAIEAVVNFCVSFSLLGIAGISAVAWGLLAGFISEKIFLIAWCRYRINISPSAYIPILSFLLYSAALAAIFIIIVLLDYYMGIFNTFA